MDDYGDVTDAQIETIGRPLLAIGTVRGGELDILRDTRSFGGPHRFGTACHLDGEGHGPCFDSRWVEEHENEEQT